MSIFRRIMLSGTNLESRKIYYVATERVYPREETIGIVMSNVWDSSTNEGIIICLNDITSIGEMAFYKRSALISITIPDSVTSLSPNVFNSCTSLTNITIPDSVTSIGERAFYECASLTSITIPGNVTSINDYVFYSCTAMQFYNFSQHSVVPTINGENAFTNIPSTCKIIVPDALYDEWIVAENWSAYTSNIIKKSDWDALQTTTE